MSAALGNVAAVAAVVKFFIVRVVGVMSCRVCGGRGKGTRADKSMRRWDAGGGAGGWKQGVGGSRGPIGRDRSRGRGFPSRATVKSGLVSGQVSACVC